MSKTFRISTKLILTIILSLSLVSCSMSKRPKMAYDQKDKGAVQEIESFNVKSSAENFRKTQNNLERYKRYLNKNSKSENLVRRIALTNNNQQETKALTLLDQKFRN